MYQENVQKFYEASLSDNELDTVAGGCFFTAVGNAIDDGRDWVDKEVIRPVTDPVMEPLFSGVGSAGKWMASWTAGFFPRL